MKNNQETMGKGSKTNTDKKRKEELSGKEELRGKNMNAERGDGDQKH